MHLAYVGTNYRGLQRQGSGCDTVEGEVVRAVHAAGGILDSNLDKLGRLRWSRSSRTDKGVHSLATVVAFNMECERGAFEVDPAGGTMAAAVNAQLPPEVRCLAVQRVNNAFNARAMCAQRAYQYYLPLQLLERAVLVGSAEYAMKWLEAAWKLFEGHRPFHNYTQRRLYRLRGAEVSKRSGSGSEGDEEEAGNQEVDTRGEPANRSNMHEATVSANAARRYISARWAAAIDPRDRLSAPHYRTMHECNVSGPIPLVAGGQPALVLSVRGASFMLHQIRHMVGAAVAAAVGLVPLEFVDASLSAPARTWLPLAPAATLVLRDNTFQRFPVQGNATQPAVAATSGMQLQLPAIGWQTQQLFCHEVLNPTLNELLVADEWEVWAQQLQRLKYRPAEVQDMVHAFQDWRTRARRK